VGAITSRRCTCPRRGCRQEKGVRRSPGNESAIFHEIKETFVK
jgi:hypothetical protein